MCRSKLILGEILNWDNGTKYCEEETFFLFPNMFPKLTTGTALNGLFDFLPRRRISCSILFNLELSDEFYSILIMGISSSHFVLERFSKYTVGIP